ncbi:MAG TPA: MmcQ/YjbR family DNA-binding protein [Allosphingosinicella sp.]
MTIDAWFEELRAYGLSLPEAKEDHPWGHSALKVRGKTFCWLDMGEGLSATVKLPVSRDFAMVFDWTEPAGYGLGKSGWVTARFPAGGEAPDLYLLRRWIAESYRAVAPKKLGAAVPDPE